VEKDSDDRLFHCGLKQLHYTIELSDDDAEEKTTKPKPEPTNRQVKLCGGTIHVNNPTL
jgi:hypothetical protein